MASLSSKWKRARPLIALYMKCHMLAISNPQSGEDAQGVIARAMLLYRGTEIHPFPHLSTHELIKDEPKWHLDCEQLAETVGCRTSVARLTVRQQLDREKAKEPTVVGTKKPKGVKKARRTIAEMSVKEKEIAREEAALQTYLDALTQKGQLGRSVVAEGSKRTRAMQEAVEDELMGTDTTGMDEASRGYYELRKKHAIEHILALEKEK